jgi:hypothetical protein
MTYLSHTKGTENFLKVLLRDHERYLPIVQFLDNVVLHMDELTWAEGELIGLELGKQNDSDFCAGIRGGMIDALDAEESALAGGKLKPVLDFARKLNLDASTITETNVQVVRDAGWSDKTVEDVIALVAVLKVYSILANGLGFKALPKAAFEEMGRATVQMRGYTPMFQSFMDGTGG